MKHAFIISLMLIVSFGAAGTLSAQESLIETVANGCKTELETYCKTVTPGEGRILACLYAYGDKLSGKCEYALYDAAARLERAVAALTYVAKECEADICRQLRRCEGG